METQTKTKSKVLKIDRSKWNVGEKYGNLGLLNNQGFFYCLGFKSKQEGFKNYQISDTGSPENIVENYRNNNSYSTIETILKYPKITRISCLLDKDGKNNKICEKIISVNDSKHFSD